MSYTDAPSAHGAVNHIFVETVDPAQDPKELLVQPRTWATAADLFYVVGVPREGVMGASVLSYTDPLAAKRVAARHSGRVLGWDELMRDWKARQQ